MKEMSNGGSRRKKLFVVLNMCGCRVGGKRRKNISVKVEWGNPKKLSVKTVSARERYGSYIRRGSKEGWKFLAGTWWSRHDAREISLRYLHFQIDADDSETTSLDGEIMNEKLTRKDVETLSLCDSLSGGKSTSLLSQPTHEQSDNSNVRYKVEHWGDKELPGGRNCREINGRILNCNHVSLLLQPTHEPSLLICLFKLQSRNCSVTILISLYYREALLQCFFT
jgi:hypothetical protein